VAFAEAHKGLRSRVVSRRVFYLFAVLFPEFIGPQGNHGFELWGKPGDQSVSHELEVLSVALMRQRGLGTWGACICLSHAKSIGDLG
jgi:hypothetical protein